MMTNLPASPAGDLLFITCKEPENEVAYVV